MRFCRGLLIQRCTQLSSLAAPPGLLQDFKQDGLAAFKLKLPEILLADTGRESLELSLAHFQDHIPNTWAGGWGCGG